MACTFDTKAIFIALISHSFTVNEHLSDIDLQYCFVRTSGVVFSCDACIALLYLLVTVYYRYKNSHHDIFVTHGVKLQ